MADGEIAEYAAAIAAEVAPIFAGRAWCWGNSDQPPSEDEIARCIHSLYSEAMDTGQSVATGGFEARVIRYCDGNADIRVTLQLFRSGLFDPVRQVERTGRAAVA